MLPTSFYFGFHMKRKFFILTFGVIATFFLTVFSVRKNQTQPRTMASSKFDASTLPTWQNISQENWGLLLPPASWEEANTNLNIPQIKLAVKNPEKRCMVILLKEPSPGTLSEYVDSAIRVAEIANILILAAYHVTINDTKFVLLKMNSKANIIWSWITVKDGVGYNLSCEQQYQMDASSNQKLCYSIADTFQIK